MSFWSRPRLAPLPALLACAALVACDGTTQRPPSGKKDAFYGYPVDAAPPPPDAGPLPPDTAPPEPDGPLPDVGPPRDAADFPAIAYAVETRVGDRSTPAGLENRLTCQALDQTGSPIPGIETQIEIHPDSGFERTEVGAIGQIARDYRLVCTVPSLGLRDPTPADWSVRPAAAALTVASLDTTEIPAGGQVVVHCDTFDAFGNPVAAPDAEVRFEPALGGDRVPHPDLPVTIERAGLYEVRCAVPGAESIPGPTLLVTPGLPAHLALRLFPDRRVYRVGSVIELVTAVTDEDDNLLPDAPLVFESDPPLPGFGEGRFQATPEGVYTLTARVDGPTAFGRTLEQSVEILVDRGGPGIHCERPGEGEFITIPGGERTVLTGTVADISGLQSVRVDGEPANLDADGTFSAEVPVAWGLNTHEVVAVDENGNENSTICTYFAATEYLDERQPLRDALLLRLGQGALDEGDPDDPLGSIADVLRRIVNSRGLRDTVHQAALAQNPVVPNECRASVLGVCLFSLGVEYRDIEIGGRNTLALTLVDGGLNTVASIRNLALTAQLQGTLGNTARISTEHITVDLTFDVSLGFDGRPAVFLRGVNTVDVGHLDSDFSGFISGAILELVFSAFEGLIRRTVTDAIRDFLENNLRTALRDLLGNVDIGALSQGFDVPLPVGGGSVRLTLTPTMTTLDFAAGRALVGIGTKVDGPDRVAGRSPGVPLHPGPRQAALPDDRNLGGAVQLALLNQVFHRLWRAGYFESAAGGLVGGVAGDLPEGTEVFLSLPTAPAVIGVVRDDGADIRVFVGPATAGVVYPGIFAEPFRVGLAASLDAHVTLQGERDLVFDGVGVSELSLDLSGAEVSERSRQVLESTLSRVLQGLIDRALNDGLPSLPLPDFEIPASLAVYDLPVGTHLGLRQGRLRSTLAHWLLDGNFGP